MANESVLSARIQVTAPGAKATFASVAGDANKTGVAISKLGQSLNALKFAILDRKEELIRTTDINRARELNVQIKQLEAELKRIQIAGTNSFGAVGAGANKTFGIVRQLAFVLPGIGIAGIFGALAGGISNLVGSIFSLGDAYNEAADDAKVFADANKKVGDDVARLQALASVAKDVSLSTTQRKNAIAELQRLYPDYLRNISLENINSQAATLAIDNLTKSIVNKAIAEVYSKRVAEESLKLLEKQEKVNVLIAKQGEAAAELTARRATEPANAIKKLTGIYNENNAKLVIATREMNAQQQVVNTLTGKLKDATIAALDFFATPKPDVIKKTKDRIKEFVELLEFKPIKLDFTAGASFTNFPDKDFNKISSRLQDQVDRLTASNPILIRANTKVDLTDFEVQVVKTFEGVNNTIRQTLVAGVSTLAQGIGQVFSGEGLKNVFQGFANLIGSGLIAIGEQLIELAVIAKLVKTSLGKLFTNPGLALAAGIALIAVGSALKAAVGGGLKGFAQGGRVQAGVPIMVGEQGREVFVPDTGGRIVPNNKLGGGNAIQGGGGMQLQIIGTNVIRGNDLVTIFAATNRSQNRNF